VWQQLVDTSKLAPYDFLHADEVRACMWAHHEALAGRQGVGL